AAGEEGARTPPAVSPPGREGAAIGAALAGARLGKYELLGVVGTGSFGVVYRARDTELRRTVAVKVPRPGSLAGREEADRFLREARSAAQLKHPHIVALHEAHHGDGTCYLVYEFVEGRTLAEQLRAGRLGFRQAAELLAQAAEALAYAHGHGVIHRDLKPSNILLDAAGQPPGLDLGLAKWGEGGAGRGRLGGGGRPAGPARIHAAGAGAWGAPRRRRPQRRLQPRRRPVRAAHGHAPLRGRRGGGAGPGAGRRAPPAPPAGR